jgi:hypothetical protein
VNFLILRDLDTHDGETEASILQSITSLLETFFAEREISTNLVNLIPNLTHPNLYMLAIPDLNFCLALHIATKRWSNNFIKSTIDDYVLELALLPKTVSNLLADINKTTSKINIPPSKIRDKITKEIPEILKSNASGIDDLNSAKDYVLFYAAVLKLPTTSPPTFARKVMANADEQDIREVFGALIAAFEFVGGA